MAWSDAAREAAAEARRRHATNKSSLAREAKHRAPHISALHMTKEVADYNRRAQAYLNYAQKAYKGKSFSTHNMSRKRRLGL